MVIAFRYFVLTFFATCNFVLGQDSRARVTVTYEYQLEVFRSTDASLAVLSANDVLDRIDLALVDGLQEMLPNDGLTINSQTMNVEFDEVSSEIYSACFTSSDECSLVRSQLDIAVEGEKPKNSVERVATRLIRDYLKNYSKMNPGVNITCVYPFWVESLVEFRLGPVDSIMTETEIEVMEETIFEVFGAVIFAMESDTEMMDTEFIYQKKLQKPISKSVIRSSSDQSSPPMALKVNFDTVGICRECSKVEFASVVEGVINANLGPFHNKLQVNGAFANSTYFENVETILFDFPSLPEGLPPIDDDAIYDFQPPQTSQAYPWYFYFGFSMSICILLSGLFVIYKDRSDLSMEKDEDEFSTASESDSSLRSDGDTKVEEYHVEEDEEASGNNTSLEEYQVETILSYSEEHTEGEYTDPSYAMKDRINTMTTAGNDNYENSHTPRYARNKAPHDESTYND
jgi:hypothetical protein